MSRRYEDDQAIVTVYNGRPSAVDTARLRWLVGQVEGALAEVQAAQMSAVLARAIVQGDHRWAPHHAALAVRELNQLLWGPRGLGVYGQRLERMRDGLRQAIDQYEAAEFTLERVLSGQVALSPWERAALAALFLASSGLPLEEGTPLWHLERLVVAGAGEPGERPFGSDGAYSTFQRSLPVVAAMLGMVLNPEGEVVTSRGTLQAHEMAPVPFLVASLLNLTRLDAFRGNLELYLRRPGAQKTLLARYAGGEVVGGSCLGEVQGEGIEQIGSFEELVAYSEGLSAESKEDGVGVISAVRNEGPDGTASWVLVLPGMQGGFGHHNPQDNITNLQLMAGMDNDLLDAARDALEALPIREGEEISFIGHSQGGIIAMELAADPEIASRFAIASVITAGSPVGQVAGVPQRTRVLHLVNVDDAVPGLAGLMPQTSENHMVVTVDFDGPSAYYNHAHEWASYVEVMHASRHEALEVDVFMTEFEELHWDAEGAEQVEYVFEFARTNGRDSWGQVLREWGYWVD